MDIKKLAMVVLIAVLIPLFLALFIDAVYTQPQYEDYCNLKAETPYMIEKINANCTYDYGQEYQDCINSEGTPRFDINSEGCNVYSECDYCSRDYNAAQDEYSRNVFLIFAVLGLIIVVLGIYLKTEYIGAGLMFGGVITLFYSSVRYFSSLNKLLRAIVILVDLLVIIYISYKKIDKK